MGDDIEKGKINDAGAQTNLFARVDSTGSWNGTVVLDVEAQVLAPQTINGIRGVGQANATPEGIPVGGVGVWGIGDIGVLGEGQTAGVIGRLSDAPSSLPPTFDNTGVLGSSFGDEQAAGVIGEGDVGYGVYGVTNSANGGVGVRGDSNNVGVIGVGVNNVGVLGESVGTAVFGNGGAIGVQGLGDVGVFGNGGAIGVQGVGDVGVSGSATNGFGVQAVADGSNGIGLYAQDLHDASGEAGVAAAVFEGRVYVNGALITFGAKSAAVPLRDGSHRLLYSIESPESWFEDFGESRLVKGKAKVKLEPRFASVIHDSFHVFLAPYGDSNGLYVSQRSKKGFEVREQGGGKGSVSFSYRIVAKRKDIKGERLAKVALPKVKPKKIARTISIEPKKLPAAPQRRA